ncbi:MAG TPA: hypothetical protein V6D34_10710 [Candidatus Sericytochromatia bacterium]
MKITFPTIDLEISLAEVEYDYLKYICQETLQTSDEVLRLQLRQLQLSGVPDFETWRAQHGQPPRLALPEATTTVDVEIAPTQVEDGQTASVEQADAPPEAPAPKTRKPRTHRTSAAKQFDPKQLLPDFRGQSLQKAVQIVLAQEPDRSFGTDELLTQIYGEFTDAELSKGRRSLGKVLSIGAKQGLWQRLQEKPPLYQATDDTPQSDSDMEDED